MLSCYFYPTAGLAQPPPKAQQAGCERIGGDTLAMHDGFQRDLSLALLITFSWQNASCGFTAKTAQLLRLSIVKHVSA